MLADRIDALVVDAVPRPPHRPRHVVAAIRPVGHGDRLVTTANFVVIETLADEPTVVQLAGTYAT